MNFDLIVLSLYILLLASIAYMIFLFDAKQKKLAQELYAREMEEQEFAELEEEIPSEDEGATPEIQPTQESVRSSPVENEDEVILRQRLRQAQTVLG